MYKTKLLFVMILILNSAYSQGISIKIKVTSDLGEPIQDVKIASSDFNSSCFTDTNGICQLNLPANYSYLLEFSKPCYEQRLRIVTMNDTNLQISLNKNQTCDSNEISDTDVVLLIDRSYSMEEKDLEPNRIEAAKRTARIILDQLAPSSYSGLVSFAGEPIVHSKLTSYHNITKRHLLDIELDSDTALGDGLLTSFNLFRNSTNEKVVIAITDGCSHTGSNPLEAAKIAKENSIVIYAVLMGREGGYEVCKNSLKEIAETTGGSLITVSNQEQLLNFQLEVTEIVTKLIGITNDKSKEGLLFALYKQAYVATSPIMQYLIKFFDIKRLQNLRIMYIPINWGGSYDEYSNAVDAASKYMLDRLPLSGCSDRFEVIKIPNNANFGSCKPRTYLSTPSCYASNAITDLEGCAESFWDKSKKDYDYVIGLDKNDISQYTGKSCEKGVAGFTLEGSKAIIAETSKPGIPVHELGHKFDLADEYCDCSGTPSADHCGRDVRINRLSYELGCDTTGNCCSVSKQAVYPGCFKWCEGNFDIKAKDTNGDMIPDSGERSAMSNKILSSEHGYFDKISLDYLSKQIKLRCVK